MNGMANGDEGEPAATTQVGESDSAPPKKAVYKVPEVTKRRSASNLPPTVGAPRPPAAPPSTPQPPQPPQYPQPPQQRPVTPWPQPQPRPRPRPTWPRNLGYAVLAGVIAAAATSLPKLIDHRQHTASVPFDGKIPGLSTESATPPKVYAHPDDRYFDGSPSFGWANGAEGITAPQAVRIGDYSAQTVAAAYDGARKLLIAADLDPTVLMGGDPQNYFSLVDPRTGYRTQYDATVANPSRRTGTPLSWITRFDPKRTRLVGHTVKTQGSMTVSTDATGLLHVVADYRFVYAVAPADGDTGHAELSLVHRMLEIVAYPVGDGFRVTPGTYWLYRVNAEASNDLCTVDDGFVNPGFDTPIPAPPGKPVDPYAETLPAPPTAAGTKTSPSASPDDQCRSATRI